MVERIKSLMRQVGLYKCSTSSFSLQIYTGKPPFSSFDAEKARQKVISGELPTRPDGIHDALWRIIIGCWERDPGARPNVETLVRQLRDLSLE